MNKKNIYSTIGGVIFGIFGYLFFKWYLEPFERVDFVPVKPSDAYIFAIFVAIDAFCLIRVALSDSWDDGGDEYL